MHWPSPVKRHISRVWTIDLSSRAVSRLDTHASHERWDAATPHRENVIAIGGDETSSLEHLARCSQGCDVPRSHGGWSRAALPMVQTVGLEA